MNKSFSDYLEKVSIYGLTAQILRMNGILRMAALM